MTRRPGHEAVLRTLDVATKCTDLISLKINMVVIKGLNDIEIPQFLELTKEIPLSVRFIEFMPFTGECGSYERHEAVAIAFLQGISGTKQR